MCWCVVLHVKWLCRVSIHHKGSFTNHVCADHSVDDVPSTPCPKPAWMRWPCFGAALWGASRVVALQSMCLYFGDFQRFRLGQTQTEQKVCVRLPFPVWLPVVCDFEIPTRPRSEFRRNWDLPHRPPATQYFFSIAFSLLLAKVPKCECTLLCAMLLDVRSSTAVELGGSGTLVCVFCGYKLKSKKVFWQLGK